MYILNVKKKQIEKKDDAYLSNYSIFGVETKILIDATFQKFNAKKKRKRKTFQKKTCPRPNPHSRI